MGLGFRGLGFRVCVCDVCVCCGEGWGLGLIFLMKI